MHILINAVTISYLNQLEEAGLLESEKVGRERFYKNVRLIKLLSEN